ncbi:putative mitochondrial elongation factor [Leptomonas pyrrhocoris]|uniref:Putative mitochondrial elongation factor n=1 Tax=Leptomonas pyrrhocoris TaxID=157538 RepID=A0A0M9FZZ9_LEPPY|nr:putative mitochondrial elongation factor [Leptomonas pyrrhocoris]KPA79399.1 putative mitochondrial elongation factor [Leptomonas pyrrhocoris]|eukprot:XP_015657838.1 putative mitochondrial elongation factor [Leptomonas pyrrhocoris]
MRRFFVSSVCVSAPLARWLHARDDVRNIAVIAHVDHGKTTLVDSMLSQSGTIVNAHNRVMDSKDQERERGITILAKNTAILLDDGKRRINIVDTPGHLDFSGEVERALQMVEGIILLVDAKEGVRPGTRYVLRKALSLNLRPIVCLNKIDKDDLNIDKTEQAVEDLFLETAHDDGQLDIKFLYGSGRSGYMNSEPKKEGTLQPLFDTIFDRVPAPATEDAETLQMLVAQVDENEKNNTKLAIGRIYNGTVRVGDVVTVGLEDKRMDALVKSIHLYCGVQKMPVQSASYGDICILELQEPIGQKVPLKIGGTIGKQGDVKLFPYKKPDAPTYSLILQESEASWKGKETSDQLGTLTAIRRRLEREAMVNTALHLSGMDTKQVTMQGRGPLHLSVIIEDMRREGYEFEIQAPKVLTRVVNGEECEPFERLSLEFKENLVSEVVSFLSSKMGEIGEVEQVSNGRVMMECVMPVRLMSNVPLKFHTLTGGDGVLNHQFDSYRPMAAMDTERDTGALISVDSGEVTDWSLSGFSTQGRFFVLPGDPVFYGQIVGENLKTPLQNLGVNVCKRNEQLGGMRSNANDKANSKRGASKAMRYTFEDCVAWVTDDELVTVTPKSIRMRKPNFNGKTSMRSLKKK